MYLISNGSSSKKFYLDLIESTKDMNFSLIISLHTEHVVIENIVSLVQLLANNVSLGFNLMFNPQKREYTHEIYNLLAKLRERYPFSLDIQLLRETFGDESVDCRYSAEDFHWRAEKTREFAALNNNDDSERLFSLSGKSATLHSRFNSGEYLYEHIGDCNEFMCRGGGTLSKECIASWVRM